MAGVLLFAGCSKEEGGASPSEDVVRFSAQIAGSPAPAVQSVRSSGTDNGGLVWIPGVGISNSSELRTANRVPQTRTMNGGDSWAAGDHVGIFMMKSGEAITGSVAVNKRHIVDPVSGKLTPDAGENVYWPQTGSCDFTAYYPWKTADVIGSGFVYPVDVRVQDDPAALDILYANVTGKSKGDEVQFIFGHVMSKVRVNIIRGEGVTDEDLAGIAASLGGMPTVAGMNLNDGKISDKGKTANIPMQPVTAATGYVACFEAIVIPQAANEFRNRHVNFGFDKMNPHFWAIPNDNAMAQGKVRVYDLTLSGEGVTLAGNSIADWTPRENDAGTATPIPIEVVKIKAGTFMMGSSDGKNPTGTPGIDLNATPEEPNREEIETQHWVKLTQDFYMGKYEVTNAQYAAFLNAKGIGSDREGNVTYQKERETVTQTQKFINDPWGRYEWGLQYELNQWVPKTGYDNHPANFITWYGAKAYADWVGGALPTEAQWEYACRGGKANLPFGIGDGTKLIFGMGNYYIYQSYQLPDGQFEDPSNHQAHYKYSTTAVGAYPFVNDFGLYNMHDNVMEWCSDCYADYPTGTTEETPVVDPEQYGINSYILRGGSWQSHSRECRSARRFRSTPVSSNNSVGFRVIFPAP